jgi:hypothetical protein
MLSVRDVERQDMAAGGEAVRATEQRPRNDGGNRERKQHDRHEQVPMIRRPRSSSRSFAYRCGSPVASLSKSHPVWASQSPRRPSTNPSP